MDRRRRRLIFLLLAAVAAVFVLSNFNYQTFLSRYHDLIQWELLIQRQGWGAYRTQLIRRSDSPLNASKPHWQSVNHRMVLIYSAFIDNLYNNNTRIRFVGLSGSRSTQLRCGINWENNVVEAEVSLRIIKRGVPLETTIYDCHLSKMVTPTTVMVNPGNNIPGIQVDLVTKASIWDHQISYRLYKFAVCIMQPVFDWNNWLRLVTFFEYYIALGAEHFVLYEYSWSPQVDKVITLYVNLNLVTVLPYPEKLPRVFGYEAYGSDPMKGTWYLAQVVPIHDCVYRMSARAQYVAMIDLDEYLVIRNQKSIPEILQERDQVDVGAFHFQSSYILHNWPEISQNISVRDTLNDRNLSTSLNYEDLQIDMYVWPPHYRSKIIVKPATIDLLEEHYVGKFETSLYREIQVGQETALIYHDKSSNSLYKYMSEKQKPMFRPDKSLANTGTEILKKLKKRFINFPY